MTLLDARKLVSKKVDELKSRVDKLSKKPSLVIIRVGDDFASGKYVANKIKMECNDINQWRKEDRMNFINNLRKFNEEYIEIVDKYITYGRYGNPYYYIVYRFVDGCIEEVPVSSTEYYTVKE